MLSAWKKFSEKFACDFAGDFINPHFQIAFKKHCCEEITQRPTKLMMCEDLETDLLGTILPNATMDGIFTVWSLNQKPEPDKTTAIGAKTTAVDAKSVPAVKKVIFTVEDVKVHSEAKIYDHVPISCKVNGLRILSWNMSGRCNPQYNKGQHEARIKNVKLFLEKEENTFDIWCIQNFNSRKRTASSIDSDVFRMMPSESKDDLYRSSWHSSYSTKFVVMYDGFTDAMVIRKALIDPKKRIPQLIPRYNDSSKKVSVFYIKNDKGSPFYLANIHLKSPKKEKPNHDLELANILDTMNKNNCFETGAVLIGSFNRTNPEMLMAKTKKNNYKSLLSSTRRKTV
jgi:hypothetical protein